MFKMKKILLLATMFYCSSIYGQVELTADGPGDTYELISSVLAPGYNPIETPDCGHQEFGEHIDEVYDNELGKFVFRFHIHTDIDNDRCIKFDRQRNEIKSYDKSPDNLLGIEGETVVYKWKFKLSDGFQSSPNFTHIHQLKSVGGSLSSMPMFTLTTRKGDEDQLELRYAITTSQVTLKKTDLAPFIGVWVEVTETITYGEDGSYEISIDQVSDGTNLFSYARESIRNWREGAEFVRPKWGIYRSLNNQADLRDETVLFADFIIKEIGSVSTEDAQLKNKNSSIVYMDAGYLYLSNWSSKVDLIQILSIHGEILRSVKIVDVNELRMDISDLTSGSYIVNFVGEDVQSSKLVSISK